MLSAGFAEQCITPHELLPFGDSHWCGTSLGVHDDIFTRAVYLRSGDEFLLVISDVMLILRPLVERMRSRISAATGIPPEKIMVAATQNHSAPAMYGGDGYEMPKPDGALGRWLDAFADQMVAAARDAKALAAPVTIRMARGEARGIAGNRRPIGHAGRVIMTWHRPKPEDIADWGVEDPTVTLFRFDREGGKCPHLLYCFSCHPNTAWATRMVSSDFYGRAAARVKERYPETVVVFLNGACGDIDPTKYMETPKEGYNAPGAFQPGAPVQLAFQDVDRFGGILGHEILRLLDIGQEIPVSRIAVQSRFLDARPIEGAPASVVTHVELQGAALGDQVAFVGVPGEPFLKVGAEIERMGIFDHAFVIGHANGYSGYMPMAEHHAAGGYGVGGCAPLGKDIGDRVVQESCQLLHELRRRR